MADLYLWKVINKIELLFLRSMFKKLNLQATVGVHRICNPSIFMKGEQKSILGSR